MYYRGEGESERRSEGNKLRRGVTVDSFGESLVSSLCPCEPKMKYTMAFSF